MASVFSALRLFVAVLREVFDENAYARFLKRANLPQNSESYSAFLREREAAVERRPRCC